MNIEKLKFYVDNWYEYIEKKNIELLEKEIGMSFKDFVFQSILANCLILSKENQERYLNIISNRLFIITS